MSARRPPDAPRQWIDTVNRFLLAVLVIVIWAMSSAFMGFAAVLSLSPAFIVICAVIAVCCLLASLVLFAYRRDPHALALAAAPGALVLAFLMLVGVFD